MIRVLSTKMLRPNQRQFLLNANFSVIEAGFITISQKPFDFTDINENLIFTSSNAVKAVANHPDVQQIRRKPCFCVGDKTAAILDEVGFTVVEVADEAALLGVTIAEKYASESFTFFSGNKRLETLPTWFSEWRVGFNEIEVYDTVLTPTSVSKPDAILFFSPSAVESFLMANALTDEVCFCIGDTTAKSLKGITEYVVVAGKPSVENVIVQAINYYKNNPQRL